MGLDNWRQLRDAAQEIHALAEKDDWDAVSTSGDKLERDLQVFFSETLTQMSDVDKALVKEEGDQLVSDIMDILKMAKKKRSALTDETGKLARGSRGISAYKKV
ncbi:hypothetical protein [Oceanospirillum sp.]|uniref:hypothetical protein n=1 Tax=Oceanospirillum sp. TaxID=2021254 RepID=UPI003A8DCCF2